MAITSKHIADLVGVSRSAVSAVLNGHYEKVSPEKREKILAMARDLRYRPNPAALGLAGRSTRLIGLLATPPLSAIYGEFLGKFSFQLKAAGYDSLLLLPANAAEEQEALQKFTDLRVDGLFILHAFSDVRRLDCPLPAVSMSPYPDQFELRVDLLAGFELATRHLLEHGHRRIGFVCPELSVVPLQYAGYGRALAAADLAAEGWPLEITTSPDAAQAALRLLRGKKLTAAVVTNDLLAARFIACLRAAGRRVPEDLAVIGFDGAAWGAELEVPLTTLVYPAAELAQAGLELLLEKIRSGRSEFLTEPRLIAPRLHLGGTCGCPVAPRAGLHWSGEPLLLSP